MKFITVCDLRVSCAGLEEARRGTGAHPDVERKADAPLSPVTEDSLERDLAALRRARALAAVRAIQAESARRFPKGLSLAAINKEIAAVRRQRRG
jgi:hypothetical protein